MSQMQEFWRVEYAQDAYKDQTGLSHSGYVVYEQALATDTGERYDVDDGYNKHPGLGKVYADGNSRRFSVHPETVDYGGGTHVRVEQPALPPGIEVKGSWRVAPKKALGYAYPDGRAPVSHLPTAWPS